MEIQSFTWILGALRKYPLWEQVLSYSENVNNFCSSYPVSSNKSFLLTVPHAPTSLALKYSHTRSVYTTKEYQSNTKHVHSKQDLMRR